MQFCYILVYVEGETEETFVIELLNQYLASNGIFIQPVKFNGNIKYNQFIKDIKRFLRNSKFRIVTMMMDIYGIHSTFQRKIDGSQSNVNVFVSQLTESLVQDINNTRFLPYFQIHEFESVIFSDTSEISNYLTDTYRTDTTKVVNEYRKPEDINFDLPPSKFLEDVEPLYSKVTDGILILKEINLSLIRSKCSNFNQWVSELEARCLNQSK